VPFEIKVDELELPKKPETLPEKNSSALLKTDLLKLLQQPLVKMNTQLD